MATRSDEPRYPPKGIRAVQRQEPHSVALRCSGTGSHSKAASSQSHQANARWRTGLFKTGRPSLVRFARRSCCGVTQSNRVCSLVPKTCAFMHSALSTAQAPTSDQFLLGWPHLIFDHVRTKHSSPFRNEIVDWRYDTPCCFVLRRTRNTNSCEQPEGSELVWVCSLTASGNVLERT